MDQPMHLVLYGQNGLLIPDKPFTCLQAIYHDKEQAAWNLPYMHAQDLLKIRITSFYSKLLKLIFLPAPLAPAMNYSNLSFSSKGKETFPPDWKGKCLCMSTEGIKYSERSLSKCDIRPSKAQTLFANLMHCKWPKDFVFRAFDGCVSASLSHNKQEVWGSRQVILFRAWSCISHYGLLMSTGLSCYPFPEADVCPIYYELF